MVNLFENQRIAIRSLGETWQDHTFVEALDSFLQINWNQRKAFYDDKSLSGKQKFLDLSHRADIGATNYIGTISFRGETINVFPKVFRLDEYDNYNNDEWKIEDLVNNLVLWMSYSDKLNFPFIEMKSSDSSVDNLLELFITIYVNYVKNALNKVPFYRYEDYEEDLHLVKGRIDINDYARNKLPNGKNDTFRCTYSKFEFDNLLNRIIKDTCRLLLNLSKVQQNVIQIRKILSNLSDVSDIKCSPYDCDKIHLNKLQRQYISILGMSKMFLMNKEANFSSGFTDSFCFMFPAELLFESFVAGFMKEQFADVATVRSQTSETSLAEAFINNESVGEAFNLREDIIVEKDNNVIVLDTKYSIIDKFANARTNRTLGISNDWMRQIAFYCKKRNAVRGVLIFPLFRKEEPENLEMSYMIPLDDHTEIEIRIIKVPFVFDDIDKNTKTLRRIILEVI